MGLPPVTGYRPHQYDFAEGLQSGYPIRYYGLVQGRQSQGMRESSVDPETSQCSPEQLNKIFLQNVGNLFC